MPNPAIRPRTTSPATTTASPAVLASFTAPRPNSDSFGRAIGFDGTNLWITYEQAFGLPNPWMYEVSTSGQLIQTVTVTDNIGALAWDPTRRVFWAGGYARSQYDVYTFDPATQALTLQFTFSPQGGNCFNQPQGYFDGLAYDPSTDSLWISDDAGHVVYNITTTGTIRSYFPFSKLGYSCQTGIAVQTYASGSPTLWLADGFNDVIVPADLDGNLLQGSFGADVSFNIAGIEGRANASKLGRDKGW